MTARNRLIISRYPSPPAPGSARVLESARHLQVKNRNDEAASESKQVKIVPQSRRSHRAGLTPVMQFISLSKPELLVMLCADLVIRQSFHGPSVELVKHLKLLRVIVVFVKELGCLNAPLEH